jgi:hypothetical protein
MESKRWERWSYIYTQTWMHTGEILLATVFLAPGRILGVIKPRASTRTNTLLLGTLFVTGCYCSVLRSL